MGVSLKKGQGVSLKKAENDLSMVTIGLGWDVREEKRGLLSSILGKKPTVDYDLDVVAFLCDERGKVRDLGPLANGCNSLNRGDVVFYNSLRHKSGAIWLTGDNRSGAGDGDDEQIVARLDDLPADYRKIVFVVQIYKGGENRQSFGEVNNAYIRAVDARGREMVRFDISGTGYHDARSMLFAELARERDGWKFQAIGEYAGADTFVHWLKNYI